MPVIQSKKQNYRLWQSGAFGNKLRAWRTVDAYYKSGFTGTVALRTLLQNGGGPCAFDLYRDTVRSVAGIWQCKGIPFEDMTVNEQAPDGLIVVQGEYLNDACIVNSIAHWSYFYFSRMKVPMRSALSLQRPEVAYDLQADFMIREAMTPSSYEDWRVLLDQYPGHVLEVSIFDRCLGDIPGRNALVWEVRRY